MSAQMDSLYPNPQNVYPDILNNPETPLRVVECYFLLRENEFHTLHYIITHVLKSKFSAEEIGEAMRIYMLP